MTQYAGIFRLQLFKTSETFIPGQVRRLTNYAPLFIGRKTYGPVPFPCEVALPATGKLTTARVVLARDPGPFLKALGHRKPAVIHAHFGIDGVYALPLAQALKRPLITTLHGFDVTSTDQSFVRQGRPALLNYVLHRRELQKSGDVFLCVSDFIRREAIKRGFPEDKLKLHYIGIDTERLTPDFDAEDDGLIVHVARLVEKKGTSVLLEAFAKIAGDYPAAKLSLIGDGPLRTALEALAAQLGVADRVTFHGATPHAEVLKMMSRASFVAAPSVTAASGDREGLPTIVFEAAALGRPILTSDSGGIKEAVVQGQTGFITQERDVEALAAYMGQLLSDKERRQTMGRAARADVLARFDVAVQTRALERIYDEAIAGKRPDAAKP